MASKLLVCELGAIDYRSALALQERLRDARRRSLIDDTLLLLEHSPAVYTRGRRSDPAELTFAPAWYAERGIEIIETRRGGKVTYHGPGQLVGYPIVAVDDVVAYVRLLEQTLVDALSEVQVSARARPDEGPDYTGVWVEDRKIASIGVHLAHGVTTHGFAVNVEARALEPFGWIVACGLPGVEMTSIESELVRSGASGSEPVSAGASESEPGPAGASESEPRRAGAPVELEGFARAAASALAQRLGLELSAIEPEALEEILAGAGPALTGGLRDPGNLSTR